MSWLTIVPVAPLRVEPSHRSEMVSQLLFGETCELLEATRDFLKVKCSYDGYEGWCQRSQLAEIAPENALKNAGFIAGFSDEVLINGESCIVPHASPVGEGETIAGGYRLMPLTQNIYRPNPGDDKFELVRSFAFRYLNTPYLWGGKSVFGVDCSGLVQQVFKMAGIWLPRDSADQAMLGETVEFLQAARLGDLAFFDNEEGKIIHVGIMLNGQEIIHSSGYVHVDRMDTQGILHHVTGVRTHTLRILKRLF